MPSAHATLASAHNVSGTKVRVERLPTNTTAGNHPVHRWFNFIAGFSPELVQACVGLARNTMVTGGVLLDPFAGCGTAPLAARLLGLHSVGYDPHPFFAQISEAKTNSGAYWESLPDIFGAVSNGISNPVDVNAALSASGSVFLNKMFEERTLASLLGAKQSLEGSGLDSNPLAFLILSRMLDYCCFAATDGIYKAPSSTKRALTAKQALDKVFATVREDAIEALSGSANNRIICKSSEIMDELGNNSIDIVVTSPPYLNNFDFAEMTRMYLYFWRMSDSWSEISQNVRSKLIVNTTTALKGHKELQQSYRDSLPGDVQREADEAVKLLAVKRAEKAGKKEYDFLVYPYLSQMQEVLRECQRVLKPGSGFHMMVSDAALYGVHIPAPRWLAYIMKSMNFAHVECQIIRPRGHRWVLDKREGSQQGLGEYYVSGRAA